MNSSKQSAVTTGSPCIGICTLDEQDLCIGCRRTLEEIEAWEDLDLASRQDIITSLPARGPAGPAA